MPETPRTSFRLTESDLAALDRLARIWGPVVPLSRTEVIRELIRREHVILAAKGNKDKAKIIPT